MTNTTHPLISAKNQWLYQQVDVEFPTKESLLGRTCYQQSQQQASCSFWVPEPLSHSLADDIYLVDFHRLTIMFALLQATRYESEQDKNNLVEFLTQIIYSPPCELYLGFEQGSAVASAIVTHIDQQILLSDIVVNQGCQFIDRNSFSGQLIEKIGIDLTASQVWLED